MMRRRPIAFALSLAAALPIAWRTPPALGDPRGDPPSEKAADATRADQASSPRREEVLAKLDNLKVSLDFTDAHLADVLNFIRDFSGIDFYIDPKVQERYADDQTKVSLKVRNLPLRSALKLLLDGKRLSAVYREGVMVVMLKEDVDKEVVLRIYDVRDLLMKVEDYQGPRIDLKPPSQTDGLGGSVFTLGSDPDKTPLTPEFIIDMVTKNCGVDTWESNPNASIDLNNGLLVVSQSKRVHAEILRFVGTLREYR